MGFNSGFKGLRSDCVTLILWIMYRQNIATWCCKKGSVSCVPHLVRKGGYSANDCVCLWSVWQDSKEF